MIDSRRSSNHVERSMNVLPAAVASNICHMDYFFEDGKSPQFTSFKEVHLGEIGLVSSETCQSRLASRNIHHIHAHPLDCFLITAPAHSPLQTIQSGRQANVKPGQFVCIATQKPFEIFNEVADARDFSEITVRIPGPLLRIHVPNIDDLCCQAIAIQKGAGAIMKSLIDLLIVNGEALSSYEADKFGHMLIECISITTARCAVASLKKPVRELGYLHVLDKAKKFIAANLSNPQLDVCMVAEHCHVSRRYLHTVFATASVTVGVFINEARLQQCRMQLQNPALRDRSIMQISRDWGFENPSGFSRTYRAKFGKTPRQDRL